MTNIICGAIGILTVGLFLGGLAISIGSIPFGIITIAVLAMASFDFYETVRSNRNNTTD